MLGLSACGFRLRSSVPVPEVLKQTHIAGVSEFSVLTQELKRVLQLAGSQVFNQPGNAKSIIQISNENFKRRVLSVDAQGRAAEFDLKYSFKFAINEAGGKKLIPIQEINITRSYKFDPNNVLAKDAEEAQIRQEMIKFSVRQMMRRIQSQLKVNTQTQTQTQ